MRIWPFAVPLTGLLLWACAGTTPAPRLSAVDPADPKAPESIAQPIPSLLQLPAAQPSGTPPAAPEPMPMGHEHQMEPPTGQASPAAEVYSCPMHPQVKEAKPGKCPICAMTLVKQPPKPQKEQQP